jgi:hypothetical protein
MPIIDAVKATIRRFICLPSSDATLLAAFVVGSHIEKATLPIPVINSLFAGSGKSQLQKILARLMKDGLYVKRPTAAGLRRTVSDGKYSLILDEADQWLFDESNMRQFALSLNAMFDSDHAVSLMAEQTKSGAYKVVQDRMSSMPVTISGKDIMTSSTLNNKKWDTVRSRTILINIEEAPPGWIERHERYKGQEHTYDPELDKIRRQISRWVKDHEQALLNCDPDMRLPDGKLVANREADKFRVLFHIADVDGCGADLREIVAGMQQDYRPELKRLLLSICHLMVTRNSGDHLSSAEIIDQLRQLDHPQLRSITSPTTLASDTNLGGIPGLKPGTKVRIRREGKTLQGYRADEIIKVHGIHCRAEDDEFAAKLLDISAASPEPAAPSFPTLLSQAQALRNMHPRDLNVWCDGSFDQGIDLTNILDDMAHQRDQCAHGSYEFHTFNDAIANVERWIEREASIKLLRSRLAKDD